MRIVEIHLLVCALGLSRVLASIQPQQRLALLGRSKQRLLPMSVGEDMQEEEPEETEPDMSAGALEKSYQATRTLARGDARHQADFVPESPPHAPEVSPSDQGEKIDQYAAEYSSLVKQVPDGMPVAFPGPSCEAACASCTIASFHTPFVCSCMATCIAGSNAEVCQHDVVGWSNEAASLPPQEWEVRCNNGRTNCTECMSQRLVADIHECQGNQICLHHVVQNTANPARKVRYCRNPALHLSDCEEFSHTPEENGWICHANLEKCRMKLGGQPFEEHIGTLDTPSVWAITTNMVEPPEGATSA